LKSQLYKQRLNFISLSLDTRASFLTREVEDSIYLKAGRRQIDLFFCIDPIDVVSEPK
jgi:hypothetical protein